MGAHSDPYRPCENCGAPAPILLGTYCPSCGTKELCVDCIVVHIAQIAEQAGRPLGA
jgi:hypothetical protein